MNHRVLVWFSSFLFWIYIADACDYRDDYESVPIVNGWFKLHRTPETFIDAFLRCKLEGAILASPLDHNFIKAMETKLEAWEIQSAVFTGIHATISKGDFTSIEGIPLHRIPLTWALDEPDNNLGMEDCIVMLGKNGTVADVKCDDTYPYVCYKKRTEKPVMTKCGTVDTGYTLEPKTGSCYKFHRHGVSWRRAQSTCLAEGGHLAIINSDTEATILKNLFAKNPEEVIESPTPDTVSLGFLDWDKKGSWYTVQGQSLEEAGFSRWEEGSPNNKDDFDGGQFCGGMYRSGNLDDIWCESINFPFICEMNPESFCKNKSK